MQYFIKLHVTHYLHAASLTTAVISLQCIIFMNLYTNILRTVTKVMA